MLVQLSSAVDDKNSFLKVRFSKSFRQLTWGSLNEDKMSRISEMCLKVFFKIKTRAISMLFHIGLWKWKKKDFFPCYLFFFFTKGNRWPADLYFTLDWKYHLSYFYDVQMPFSTHKATTLESQFPALWIMYSTSIRKSPGVLISATFACGSSSSFALYVIPKLSPLHFCRTKRMQWSRTSTVDLINTIKAQFKLKFHWGNMNINMLRR